RATPRTTPRRWPTGCKVSSRSRPATRSSTACSARRSRIWRRCACRSRAPITWSFCRLPGCPGSVRPSDPTAWSWPCRNFSAVPPSARAPLEILGSLQAREEDDYRDAEPGKILHEMRYGELAHFKLVPHTPYYGTADATPLYLITLHAAWRAIGERALLERHLETAE